MRRAPSWAVWPIISSHGGHVISFTILYGSEGIKFPSIRGPSLCGRMNHSWNNQLTSEILLQKLRFFFSDTEKETHMKNQQRNFLLTWKFGASVKNDLAGTVCRKESMSSDPNFPRYPSACTVSFTVCRWRLPKVMAASALPDCWMTRENSPRKYIIDFICHVYKFLF